MVKEARKYLINLADSLLSCFLGFSPFAHHGVEGIAGINIKMKFERVLRIQLDAFSTAGL